MGPQGIGRGGSTRRRDRGRAGGVPAQDGLDRVNVRLIFDASAVAAFGQHETVGEIIGELSSLEGFGVTTAGMAEAVASGADLRLMEILQRKAECAVFVSTA